VTLELQTRAKRSEVPQKLRREHDATAAYTSQHDDDARIFEQSLTHAWVPSLIPIMRSTALFSSCIAALSSFACAELNLSEPLLSKQVLPSTFAPPQVFKNANLVRTINLDKAYPRETINVIIENVDSKPQSEYYLPFETSLIAKIGGLEVRDKKSADKGIFQSEVVGLDTER
jgi:hypothetical protein